MPYEKKLLTCRFKDTAVEQRYQAYAAEKSINYDRLIYALGGLVYSLYAVLDFLVLEESEPAIAIRIISAIAAFSFVFAIKFKIVARHFESICAVMIGLTGLSLNAILLIEADPLNPYYVGLLHVAIFLGTLLRVGVRNAVICLGSIVAGYMYVSKDQIGTPYHTMSIAFMSLVFLTALVGVYTLERRRRDDYETVKRLEEALALQKQLLAAEALAAAQKDSFFKIFTHFMKTPLHMIIGYTELIKSDAYGDLSKTDYHEPLEHIHDATNDLKRFTERVISYSRLDHADPEANLSRLSLKELIANAKDQCSLGRKIDVEISEASIICQPKLITEALSELVDNIIKHAPEAEEISITAHVDEMGCHMVLQDNGPGITPEKLVDTQRPLEEITEYLSMGQNFPLGLRYAKKIIELYGGGLTVQAPENFGTKIEIFLPILDDIDRKQVA